MAFRNFKQGLNQQNLGRQSVKPTSDTGRTLPLKYWLSDKRWARPKVLIPSSLVLFAVLYFLFGDDGIYQSLMIKRDIHRAQARIDSLAERTAAMRERNNLIEEENLRVIEEEARERGMVRKGEKVYIMRPEEEKPKNR